MIARRLLIYFLALCGALIAATVAFERYAMRRAIDRSIHQNLLLSKSVARYVRGVMDREGRLLGRVLEDWPSSGDRESIVSRLRTARGGMLGGGGVAVFDAQRRLLGADLAPDTLPPSQLLLPALRQAEQRKGFVVTDLWRTAGGAARIALCVSNHDKDRPLVAVSQLPVASQEFTQALGYLQVGERSSIQLLDSRGVALFSTRAEERLRSVVHGTFLLDRVRLGESSAMTCHSCHDETTGRVREPEVAAVAPVPHSEWSVAVRQDAATLFAPLREMTASSMGLVVIFFGAFLAFFALIARRVLRPLRQLANATVSIARGHDQTRLPLDARDEFGLLAASFETVRRKLRPTPTSEGLQETCMDLDGILEGLLRIDPIRAVMLWTANAGTTSPRVFRSRGIEIEASEPLEVVLARAAGNKRWVSVEDLATSGARARCPEGTTGFHVRNIQVGGEVRGQIWIGSRSENDDVIRFLDPVLELLTVQVGSLLERDLLCEHLRRERDLKSRLVGRLFEATEEERKRIARELHDETAQLLSALLLLIETFPGPEDPQGQARNLEVARQRVRKILDETSRLIRRLRPSLLDDLGLVEAIRAMGREVFGGVGVAFDLQITGTPQTPPREVENTVYRVLQEAMTNVVRHASAHRVWARLVFGSGLLEGFLEDDGSGVDLRSIEEGTIGERISTPRSWGLIGMRERVAQVGGTLRFARTDTGGLRIAFSIPLGEPPAAGGTS